MPVVPPMTGVASAQRRLKGPTSGARTGSAAPCALATGVSNYSSAHSSNARVTYRLTRPGAGPFAAIADPTRRMILDLLRMRERSADDLARCFPVSRTAISRHVRVLKRVGLIRERRQSQLRYYALEPARLAEVDRWLAPYRPFWAAQWRRLREVVEREHPVRVTPAAGG